MYVSLNIRLVHQNHFTISGKKKFFFPFLLLFNVLFLFFVLKMWKTDEYIRLYFFFAAINSNWTSFTNRNVHTYVCFLYFEWNDEWIQAPSSSIKLFSLYVLLFPFQSHPYIVYRWNSTESFTAHAEAKTSA